MASCRKHVGNHVCSKHSSWKTSKWVTFNVYSNIPKDEASQEICRGEPQKSLSQSEKSAYPPIQPAPRVRGKAGSEIHIGEPSKDFIWQHGSWTGHLLCTQHCSLYEYHRNHSLSPLCEVDISLSVSLRQKSWNTEKVNNLSTLTPVSGQHRMPL